MNTDLLSKATCLYMASRRRLGIIMGDYRKGDYWPMVYKRVHGNETLRTDLRD